MTNQAFVAFTKSWKGVVVAVAIIVAGIFTALINIIETDAVSATTFNSYKTTHLVEYNQLVERFDALDGLVRLECIRSSKEHLALSGLSSRCRDFGIR